MHSFRIKMVIVAALMLISVLTSAAQQIADEGFDPAISSPTYQPAKGTLILVDEAHHNFHTIGTRYAAFARVLRKDGYRVQPNQTAFSAETLKDAKILVIANALNKQNIENWVLPNPSAFTQKEIAAIENWVKNGGSLFFIADHMPMAGAGEGLAKAFGFKFYNGFATDTTAGLDPGAKKELDIFTSKDGTLASHAITKGRKTIESVNRIATFTGQGFKVPANAVSLLTFNDRYKILLPDTAWKFSKATPRKTLKGLSQGSVLQHGKGRVAIFGEAAMFTAQLKGKDKQPFGLNSPDAAQNVQFLLNVVHWLDEKL